MLNNICKLNNRVSRSISAENKQGKKNGGDKETTGTGYEASKELGVGWKVSPSIDIEPNSQVEIADIAGPGLITSMWMTITSVPRYTILRIYWDDQSHPSVEVPAGDFFACANGELTKISAIPINVNPYRGFNSYWQMPFNKRCRITIENLDDKKMTLFYQINYELGKNGGDMGYFHAQFRRTNPLEYKKMYTIVDGIKGKGQYVGTYLFWQSNNNYWWGEGEIKFYLDDDEFPTIQGTGTEDYFGGAWCFENPNDNNVYVEYSNLYTGFSVVRPDLKNSRDLANTRFNLYRYHILDPIRFDKDLTVKIQALGWRSDFKRYLPLRDDISSVAIWYQTLPSQVFPKLPCKDDLEII